MTAEQTVDNSTSRLPNPIYQRVTRSAKPPTIKQTAALTVILLLISTVLTSLNREDILVGPLVIAVLENLLLAPVIAGFAAQITANDARSEGFALQKITLLLRDTVVVGYSRAAWFRARLLVALVIGFLPVLAGSTQITIRPGDCHIFMSRSEYATTVPPNLEVLCAPEGDIRFILLPLSNLLAMSAIALVALPAALFGVWLGLALRHPILSAGIAILVTAFVNVVYLLIPMFANDKSFLCRADCYVFHPWPDPLYWFGAAVGVLAMLTLGLYWAALRAV